MKINNTQKINFQKKLIGLGAIKAQNVSKGVKFFQLDDFADIADFKAAQKTQNWFGNYYLNDVVNADEYYFQKFNVYSMEDEASNLLGYFILKHSDKETILSTIETAPRLSCYKEQRPAKYIGETMMAFIASISGDKNVKVFDIAQRPKTKNFYFSQCRFSKIPFSENAILRRRNFKKLINANEAHTGKKVELIG